MRTNVISEETVSESIRIMLAFKNMSSAQLAEKINIKANTIYSKMFREHFSTKELSDIALALDATYSIIFTPIQDEQSKQSKQEKPFNTAPENLSETLRVLFVKKKTNAMQVAKAAGMSTSTIYAKLKRNLFDIDDLNAISKALGCSCRIEFEIHLD